MFMSLLSHLLSAWFAFLLPCFSTFKALSHRPLSEPELQRWSMYWSVIGLFVAFEYLAEWLISWLPFYWEVKTLFLLFLALPQTEGSTYIYKAYLEPFFAQNEADLDAGVVAIQRNALAFLQQRLASLWEFVWSILNKPGQPSSSGTGQHTISVSGTPALSLQSVMGLWQTYGPSVLTAFGSAGRPAPTSPNPGAGPAASTGSFRGASAERGAPRTPEDEANPSNVAPPFPEPRHF